MAGSSVVAVALLLALLVSPCTAASPLAGTTIDDEGSAASFGYATA